MRANAKLSLLVVNIMLLFILGNLNGNTACCWYTMIDCCCTSEAISATWIMSPALSLLVAFDTDVQLLIEDINE